MPDHLHVLAGGADDHSDLLELIRLFKQRTAFTFRKATAKRLWEMGFYDYILRSSDAIESVAAYIWWNPVRKGICKAPTDFLFSGSQTIAWISRSGLDLGWTPPWVSEQPKERNGSKDPPLRIAGHRRPQ